MKKTRSILITFIAIMMFSTLLISCGNRKGEITVSSKAESAGGNVSEKDASSKPSNGKFASIQEYVESPQIKSQTEEVQKKAKEQNMLMETTADGDKVIHSYTHIVSVDADSTKVALDRHMEKNKASVAMVLMGIKDAVDVENPILVYRYFNADGSPIAEYEFRDSELNG